MSRVARGRDVQEDEPGGNESFEIADGRVEGPFVKVPLWIMFGASAKARALYEALSAHRDWWATGSRVEGATLAVLGFLIDVSDPKAVRKYLRELETLGAIDIVRRKTAEGLNATNVYVIHHIPPDGFTGPRTLKEFYARYNDKTAGQPAGVSGPPRSNQGKPGTSPKDESGKTDENRVSAGRPVGVSGPLRGGPHTPLVGGSGPPVSRSSSKNKNLPPTPRHTGTASAGAGAAPTARGEGEIPEEDKRSDGAAVPSPRTAVDSEGQDVAEDAGELAEAREVLAGLPAPLTPNARAVRELAPAVAAALADGWTAEGLAEHLAADPPARVRNVRKILAYRLNDLPPAPRPKAASPALPPHCGDPDCRGGWLDNDEGPPRRCSTWPHQVEPAWVA